MPYTVQIKLADDTMKEFTFGSDIDLPTGLGLDASQIQLLLSILNSIADLMGDESWKQVRVIKVVP